MDNLCQTFVVELGPDDLNPIAPSSVGHLQDFVVAWTKIAIAHERIRGSIPRKSAPTTIPPSSP